MRIAIDMLSCQTESRNRGIGRYSLSLARELASMATQDGDIIFGLDASHPGSVRELRALLRRNSIPGLAPATCYPHAAETELSPALRPAAAMVRSRFYSEMDADVLLVTSFFEFGSPHCSDLDPAVLSSLTTAVIAYDIIPYLFPEHYLPNGHVMSDWYKAKLEAFKQFDLFLAISESTRSDLIEHLGIEPERIRVIGAGLDESLMAQSEDSADLLAPLGVQEPFVLMVGNADWRKNSIGALHAYAALPKHLQEQYQLVLTQIGDDVRQAMAGPYKRLRHRVVIVGKVCERTLAQLYRKCEVFFFPSLYEGFGLPLIEAMALGAPVISSNQGALAEVIHDPRALFDPRDPVAATSALQRALEDPAFRATLREGGRDHAVSFKWSDCARLARAAFAEFVAQRQTRERQRHWQPTDDEVHKMADACLAVGPESESILRQGLESIAAGSRRRILVDMTEVVRLDARSGIQRVVRNYFAGLVAAATMSGQGQVEPIRWTEDGIVYARSYARDALGVDCPGADTLVTPKPGDVLFMLDSSWWSPDRFVPLYEAIHAAGGEVVWMVYDLVPINHPQYCDPGMPPAFRQWLNHASAYADGFICISDATQSDLESFLNSREQTIARRPWSRSLHLGSDLESGHALPPTQAVADIVQGFGNVPWLAALGTIEPRKDYATVLSAYERLWADGVDVALVIIGKKGWNIDSLTTRIQTHPSLGTRLFWLEGLGDGDVQFLLSKCSALIQASIAEGFGLPVVEAGSLGVPLLLSSLPVFQEIAGDEAMYFETGNAGSLAEAIKTGIANGWRRPKAIRTMTWRESSEALLRILLLNIKAR